MGKYSEFLSQKPLVRIKSAIFITPKGDDEHPCHFYMGVPLGRGAFLEEALFQVTCNINVVIQLIKWIVIFFGASRPQFSEDFFEEELTYFCKLQQNIYIYM